MSDQEIIFRVPDKYPLKWFCAFDDPHMGSNIGITGFDNSEPAYTVSKRPLQIIIPPKQYCNGHETYFSIYEKKCPHCAGTSRGVSRKQRGYQLGLDLATRHGGEWSNGLRSYDHLCEVKCVKCGGHHVSKKVDTNEYFCYSCKTEFEMSLKK